MKVLYDRVKILCSERGITVTKLESDLHFGSSSVKKWSGNSSPSVDKAIALSDYFNVSIDYLVGRTDVRYSVSEVITDTDISMILRAMQKMSTKDIHRAKEILEIVFYSVFSDL